MRRALLVLLALMLLVSALGCAGQASGTVKNELFTEAFFTDVVKITDTRFGPAVGGEMGPILQYLKGLTLTATDEHLSATDDNGDQLWGQDAITFTKKDGTEIVFLRNHLTISCVSGSDISSYVIVNGNLNDGLKEAFGQTEKLIVD